MTELKKKPLFNPEGDPDVRLRRMIGGNTTNLNDFNNMKYAWVSDWYRQAMNNFWIPEEINLSQDVKENPSLKDIGYVLGVQPFDCTPFYNASLDFADKTVKNFNFLFSGAIFMLDSFVNENLFNQSI